MRLLAGFVAALLVAALLVAACTAAGGSSTPSGGSVTIFAAASLNRVMDRAIAAFTAEGPGRHVVASYDGSSSLRAQIEQGARVDLFFSADVRTAQALADEGLSSSPVSFATTRLVVVVPRDNPAAVRSPIDLARPGLTIVGAAPEVPIARYTEQLLERLARLPGYPADFAARVGANIVSREQSVSAVAAKVELGEADAAIVYDSDAHASPGLLAIQIPDEANVRATYAAVTVGTAPPSAEAAEFLEFVLRSPTAGSILTASGFDRP